MHLRATCVWVTLGAFGSGSLSQAQECLRPGMAVEARLQGQGAIEPDREEPRLLGRAGGAIAYTLTQAELDLDAALATRSGDGEGADLSGPRLLQTRFLDSRCSFPAACGGPCNVVVMTWTETLENPQGVTVLLDGEPLATVPGLPAAQLPGTNGINILGVAAGLRTFRAEDLAGGASVECAFPVLDAQPFGDVSDVSCRQGALGEGGACEVLVSWNNPGPFPDDIGINLDGAFVGTTGGNRSSVRIPDLPPGEHCVDVFGFKAASDCARYIGCGLRTCCTLTCEPPPCAPPRNLILCQLTYGPDPADNSVGASWINGEDDYVGITGLRDDVLIGTIAGDSEFAAVANLSLGLHRIGIQGDCGPPDGLSAIAEQDIVVRDASPHLQPLGEEGIACTFTPDPDGEGPATSETRATWTNRDPSLFIDVYAVDDQTAIRVTTLAGDATEVTLINTTPTHRVGLQFFAAFDGDCYGSPLFSCDSPAPPTSSYIQGLCNGAGSEPQISTAVFFLNFLFLGGPEPPCIKACDANGDGNGDLSDGVYVLAYLFLGGPPPTLWMDEDGDSIPDPTCTPAAVEDDCELSHEACS